MLPANMGFVMSHAQANHLALSKIFWLMMRRTGPVQTNKHYLIQIYGENDFLYVGPITVLLCSSLGSGNLLLVERNMEGKQKNGCNSEIDLTSLFLVE